MRRALLLLGAVAVAGLWSVRLRPATLGGSVSYIVVHGSSMEPTYDDGDLVVVRRDSEYESGDVIAFRAGGHFEDPTRIIHRIVGGEPTSGFVTQGDNRDRTDPWSPTTEDIIGRTVLHIPMAGDISGMLTKPQTFAALGGTAVLVGGAKRRRRRRRTRNGQPVRRPIMSRVQRVTSESAPGPRRLAVTGGGRFTQPRWAFVGLVVAALLALPVLALTWSALRSPDATERTETIGSVDYGIGLDYRFTGPPSAVYPDGAVEGVRNAAGAVAADGPLYSRLLDRLDVTVAFRAAEEGADRLTSTYALEAAVETPGGWRTELATVESSRFDGSATETVSVDLPAVARQVASVAALTGVGGDAYTITVSPTLDIEAVAGSNTVAELTAAPMTFEVEGNIISAKAVETSDSQQLTRTVSEPAMYTAGPVEMETQPARAALSGLALVLVAGIVWFASVLFGGVGLGEPAKIAARYRSQMIDVAVATAPPGPVVMVGGIDELARIARVEQTVILHEDLGDGAHRYRVFLGSVTYEYEVAPEHAGSAADLAVGDADPGGG